MSFSRKNPINTNAWLKLSTHFEQLKAVHLQEMFSKNSLRESQMSVSWEDFFVDFSKNRWTSETIELFQELASELNLKESIALYFKENKLNFTEDRAVLHTALRSSQKEILLNNKNIIPEVQAVNNKIKQFSETVISGERKGYTG